VILDSGERRCISNLGCVDHGSLNVVDTTSFEDRQVAIGDAEYLSVSDGDGVLFSSASLQNWIARPNLCP
jgi:hypothetical protein